MALLDRLVDGALIHEQQQCREWVEQLSDEKSKLLLRPNVGMNTTLA